jgi:hypothetical protein
MKKIKISFFIICILMALNSCDTKPKTQVIDKVANNVQMDCDTCLSKVEYKDSLIRYDLSSLWTSTDNNCVFGYIGDHFQRLRIKIITAVKDKKSSDTYFIKGKSMTNGNISDFTGTIKIIIANTFLNIHEGVDSVYENIRKEGVLKATYLFSEDPTHPNSGVFDGTLTTFWYIDDKNLIVYDKIEFGSDIYCNNQFEGIWTSNKTKMKKTCNWGDYRIPFSRGLDQGAAEFSPTDKYLKYGWQTYRDTYFNNNKKALQEETKIWWK